MTNDAGATRPASSVVVVRPAPGGVELLLLQRANKGDLNSGAWVFPGGLVDASDADVHPFCTGLDDAAASARLGLAQGGLDYYIAAIRECFEEVGLLLAIDEHDAIVDGQGGAAGLAALRGPLQRGDLHFDDVCREHGLRLAVDRLFYVAHWLTPPGMAKRFDTRFFLAVLPHGQTARHDAVEAVDHLWLRPAELLAPQNARRLLRVTRTIIEMIAPFADMEALMAWACSPRDVPLVMQRRCRDSAGARLLMPHEPAWAEVGRLDPLGEGTAWCELRPGVAVRLSQHVQRVTRSAGAGGNSYLVGNDQAGWAVIDPGSADEAHLAALIAAASGRIHTVLLSATGDTSGAILAARTGAHVQSPSDKAEITLPGDVTLRAIADPERASHLAGYLLVEEKTLFTGAATLDVQALPLELRQMIEWVAPGHGFLVPCGAGREPAGPA